MYKVCPSCGLAEAGRPAPCPKDKYPAADCTCCDACRQICLMESTLFEEEEEATNETHRT